MSKGNVRMYWLAIAVGGALGAVGRYGVNSYLFPLLGNRFPLGTFIVNVVGSLLIGVCYVLIIEKGIFAPHWRHVTMTGFLGAFTTFSNFSLDAFNLWQNGHGLTALIYVGASVIACLVAVAFAAALTARLV